MKEIIKNLTLGDYKRFYKSVIFTSLSDIVGFLGIFIVILFVDRILEPFVGKSGDGINANVASLGELLLISVAGFIYMIIYYFACIPAYKANYETTYKLSAKWRLDLAKHICKLPLGFLQSRNPAKLTHSLMNDFAMLEMANSHMLSQTCSSLILSLLVFIGLCVYQWQMALAFFACVPFAIIILIAARSLVNNLSNRHQQAVFHASNVINEYINGITTIKMHNMAGAKFERLQKVFDNLRKQSIRMDVLVMPFALSVILCMGAGIGIMVMVGREFLVSAQMSVTAYIAFLLIGSKAFVPLMTFCLNLLELQYVSKAGNNILELYKRPIATKQ